LTSGIKKGYLVNQQKHPSEHNCQINRRYSIYLEKRRSESKRTGIGIDLVDNKAREILLD